MTPKTARFWFFCNEWARITLRVSETVLTYRSGGETDEGYSVEEWRFQFDGEYVTVAYESDSRDCDGRYGRESEIECHVSQLTADVNEWSGLRVPAWKPAYQMRRDYSAEAAGY